MNFDPPESVKPLLARIATFVAEHVIPAEREVLERGFIASHARLEELRARVKQGGMWGPQIPKELGGLGLGLLEHGLVSEQLGKSPLGHYVFGCQAPDAGNLEVGHKWFTSSADGASFAIVMAVTNPDAAPHGRASMIIVPTDAPGFERVRNIKIMGDAGEGWASHAEIRYTNVRVPVANRLGPEGAGFLIAQERLGPGRIHHCMRWIGVCERVFDTMCRHVAHRKIDGDKTLATRQIAQAWVAEARAEIDASRLMVLHAAWTLEQK